MSVAIQTHPLRLDMATELLGCLRGEAEIVADPDPYGSPPSPWRTYRLALERGLGAPSGTTHRLVLQDDTIVCDYFWEGIEAAAEARPGRVLAFFLAGGPPVHSRRFDHAHAHGLAWAALDNTTWCPVVATAWPVELLEPMLTWTDEQHWPPAFTADDEIAGRFLRAAGINALASVPSLVEHPDTVTSLASGGRRHPTGQDRNRLARLWIGDCGCDPRAIDWTSGPA